VSDILVVAIDGPAGAGKSTVGRAVAARLDLEYLDTGAMYRGVTFGVLRRGLDPSDVTSVARVAAAIDIRLDGERLTVDGVDATIEIRGREVTSAVSAVAARGGAVVEGRDIGSVVFPDAPLKLYITASPRVRAERRVADIGGDVKEVEASIIERDRKDSTRDDSPLTEASGSIVVDTSGFSINEVVEHILGMLPHDQG
jgi:cytidylate kinase